MQDKVQKGSEADREARRRLLRLGAVGAPVVLTFRGTSAWALSAGCLVQEGNLPIPGRIIRVDENFQPIPKLGSEGGFGVNSYGNGNNGNNGNGNGNGNGGSGGDGGNCGNQYGNGGKNQDKGNANCNGQGGQGGQGGPGGAEAWYDQYETVFVTQDPYGAAADRVVDGNTDINGLRALVHNGNIGITCLQSITTMV